jgi:hypothetical protein
MQVLDSILTLLFARAPSRRGARPPHRLAVLGLIGLMAVGGAPVGTSPQGPGHTTHPQGPIRPSTMEFPHPLGPTLWELKTQ